MRIAVFSDIHGNLPALEMVMAAIQNKNIDQLYCLGDLVNFAPWPNEVIEFIRHHQIATVCGNHDWAIGLAQSDFAFSYNSTAEKQAGLEAIAYTNEQITENNRDYLRSMPKIVRLDFELNAGPTDILLTHGSPRSIGEYIFEDYDEAVLMKIMDEYGADLLMMGHTHRPYYRKLESVAGKLRQAINVGSVGKPKDGDPRAAYTILTMENGGLSVEQRRVTYDIERTRQAILKSKIPDLYADLLIKS